MSLESGGRGDKYGNEYENRYLAKLLLRLVKESISGIVVEPVGENSDSVEFVTETKDGFFEYYQCKASNSTDASWSLSDLQRYAVFTRAKRILTESATAHYFFISPLAYNELDELCKRARTTASAKELADHQLTNPTIRRTFADCAKEFGLDVGNTQDLDTLVSLLSRCYFERCPDGVEAISDLEERISFVFTGNASGVRTQLEQFANSTGKYGITISAKDVVDYLEACDIHLRSMNFDERCLPRINTLNDTYWDVCPAINGRFIHREASSRILQRIKEGGSVILHGKAGSGKSGCLQEVVEQLKDGHILYLATKLDKIVPEESADNYGRQLGLPQSPICCLAALAGKAPCVLILDQLDALRWTLNHSAAALNVCKELIYQANALNKYEGKSISIVFASRTFDLENDSGLRSLFIKEKGHNSFEWERISINDFTQDEVVQLIGDSYNSFPSRLQKLLLTPSTLYVWTQLEERRRVNSVSSVYQLMHIWWKQIQDDSEIKGIARERLTDCKNRIVGLMEKQAVFLLPTFLFPDEGQVITALISSGMLREQGNKFSFVHQSFLDFFITSEYLSKIYNGSSIVDLIGSYDKQIPQIRYRLVSVLQNLIESDQSMFVIQGHAILKSDQVHFYFQCAVFEVIGQCDAPEESVYALVDQYVTQNEWSNYIIQVVFYAHPAFVEHLAARDCNWLEDTNLSLLKSISAESPDFVVNTLRVYDSENSEIARKIFWALSADFADDSDDMFCFRVELIKKHPFLLDDSWFFPNLFTRNTAKAIQLLKLIVELSNDYNYQRIFLGEKDIIDSFVTQQYESIVKELFPIIIQNTSDLVLAWPFHRYSIDDKNKDWFSSQYERSVLRSIIDLTKLAVAEYAKKRPSEFVAFFVDYSHFSSAICHEILSHALICLPDDQSDVAIRWLLSDFNANVFVFTDDQEDYLSYSKQIIRKFSPTCSSELFRKLEDTICGWTDNSERMCNIYKHRIETNKRKQFPPVYYAFWGQMQKELLPCLNASRLSRYSQELIQVLHRNTWVDTPHFSSGSSGSAKYVVSPIEHYVEQISDARWIKIISTPKEKMGSHWHGEDEEYYVEADHRAFAASLGRQAKCEPARFAQLSLAFPDRCYIGYILSVLFPLEETEGNGNTVDLDLICNVIRRFCSISDPNVAIAISRIIERRANEPWPDDILDLISAIAITHPDPKEDGFSITSNDDPEHLTIRSMHENAINCARGCALHAVAALLWENKALGARFKTTVSTASKDKNPAVRFAVLNCLLPFFNYDRTFAIAIFKRLLNSDLRIIGANGFWDLLARDYSSDKQYYLEKMFDACKSVYVDLSSISSGMLCALAVYKNDDQAYNAIKSLDFSDKQQDKICSQAISSFNSSEFHSRSEEILLTIVCKAKGQLRSLSHLFFHKQISVQRDAGFLIFLMKSTQSHELLYSFLNYLKDSDDDLCQYAEVLKTTSDSLVNSPDSWRRRMDVQDFVHCVIRLSDRGKDNPVIQSICLAIWDNLFRSNLKDIKPLSGIIDNFE